MCAYNLPNVGKQKVCLAGYWIGSMKIFIGLNISILLKVKFHQYFDRDPSRVYLISHLLDSHLLATISIFRLLPISGWVPQFVEGYCCFSGSIMFYVLFDNPEEEMAHCRHHHPLLHLPRDGLFVSFHPGRGLGMRNTFTALTSTLHLQHYHRTNLFLWKKQTVTLKPVPYLYLNPRTLHWNMGYREMWAKCICLFGLAGNYLEPNKWNTFVKKPFASCRIPLCLPSLFGK